VTGPEHYGAAEVALAAAAATQSEELRYTAAEALLDAIAHATLALTAATALSGITLTLPDGSDLAADWNRTIFNEEGVA
jgi:hypothetical protein